MWSVPYIKAQLISHNNFTLTPIIPNYFARNTRYGWMVSPYPIGTYTLQEMPSFAWRTHATLATFATLALTLIIQPVQY